MSIKDETFDIETAKETVSRVLEKMKPDSYIPATDQDLYNSIRFMLIAFKGQLDGKNHS